MIHSGFSYLLSRSISPHQDENFEHAARLSLILTLLTKSDYFINRLSTVPLQGSSTRVKDEACPGADLSSEWVDLDRRSSTTVAWLFLYVRTSEITQLTYFSRRSNLPDIYYELFVSIPKV